VSENARQRRGARIDFRKNQETKRGRNPSFIGISALCAFLLAKSNEQKFSGRGAAPAAAMRVVRGGRARQLHTKAIEVTVNFFLL
jgi:hypothetical protein